MTDFEISNIIYEKSFRKPTKEERQDLLLLIDILFPYIGIDTIYALAEGNSNKADEILDNLETENYKYRQNLNLKNKIWQYNGTSLHKMLKSFGFYYPISWTKEIFFNKKKLFKPNKKDNRLDNDWNEYFRKLSIDA